MSRTQRVSTALLVAGVSLASVLLAAGCEAGGDSNAGSGGTGAVAGMVGTGGVSGMVASGGAGGVVASGGAGGVVASGGAGGTIASGGAGGMNVEPAGPPTFSAIFSDILTKGAVGNCTFGACHGADATTANGMLHLISTDKAATHAALVNVPSASAACAGQTLVVPGQPEMSLLLLKMTAAPPCGLQMPVPPLGTHLTDAQMAQVSMWIANGAMND